MVYTILLGLVKIKKAMFDKSRGVLGGYLDKTAMMHLNILTRQV